jgi:hypothetical protein
MACERRSPFRLVDDNIEPGEHFAWFCGRCAAPSCHPTPERSALRICPSCGLGLLLRTRAELAPAPGDAFLIVDTTLAIGAVSERAEQILQITEHQAVYRQLTEVLVPAQLDRADEHALIRTVSAATTGRDSLHSIFVTLKNTYGIRIRARIGSCAPPRAGLIVLDTLDPAPRGR